MELKKNTIDLDKRDQQAYEREVAAFQERKLN